MRPRSRVAVTVFFTKRSNRRAFAPGAGVELGDRTSPQGADFELAEPTTLQFRHVVGLISRVTQALYGVVLSEVRADTPTVTVLCQLSYTRQAGTGTRTRDLRLKRRSKRFLRTRQKSARKTEIRSASEYGLAPRPRLHGVRESNPLVLISSQEVSECLRTCRSMRRHYRPFGFTATRFPGLSA